MFDRVRGWMARREERKLSALMERSGLPIGQLRQLAYGPPTIAGVAVTEESALGISAVYRAVNLIASTVASLDASVARRSEDLGTVALPRHWTTLLIRDPNDAQNHFKFWRAIVGQAVSAGNGYAEIERDELDRPVGLHLIHWRSVRPFWGVDGQLCYQVKHADGKKDAILPASDVLHLAAFSWDGIVGISPIQAARETLGITVAAERHAGSVFGNGGVPRGFLKVKGMLNAEGKANVREAWDTIHGGPENGNKVGILFNDTEWQETNLTPHDAQLLASRAFQIEEVARIFGVPVNLLFSGTQSSYNSNEESNIQFYQLGLRTLIEGIESEIDFKLLSPRDRSRGCGVKFDVSAILRGNFKAQVEAWSRLVLTGMATPNEGRRALGMNPIEGGDERLIPTNMQVGDDKGDGLKIGLAKPGAKSPAAGESEGMRWVSEAFRDAIARSLRREAKSRPSPEAHRAHVVEAVGPCYRAFAAMAGIDPDVQAFARRWVDLTSGRAAAEVEPDEILALAA